MRSRMRALIALGSLSALALVVAGCSGTDDGGGGEADGAGFGECEIASEAGSVDLHFADPDRAVVATVLPNPGSWNGDTPESIRSGFEYCIAAEIANLGGASSFEIKNLAWDQFISGSTSDYDFAISGTTITDERKEIFDFTRPYFQSNLGIAVKEGSDVTEQNFQDKRIGVLQGNMGAAYVQDELGLSPSLFQSQPDMFTALQAGQVDAVVTDTVASLTATNASDGALFVVAQIALDQGYGVVTPKGDENSAALDEAIGSLADDGVIETLSERWLKPYFGVDPNAIEFWKVG